jgi:hypothetical protein
MNRDTLDTQFGYGFTDSGGTVQKMPTRVATLRLAELIAPLAVASDCAAALRTAPIGVARTNQKEEQEGPEFPDRL